MNKVLALILPLALVGYVALPRRAPQAPASRLPDGELIATISRGESIALETCLEEGKWTVLEFGAVW
jgi:hypothetical protein